MEGIIIKNESNNYTVKTASGLLVCKPRGKFRFDNISPLVGDIVAVDDINNYIIAIKERRNSLIRPSIANVDVALIVTSVKEPIIDYHLLDKLLTIISYHHVEPIICLTKIDLLEKDEEKMLKSKMKYYQKAGYRVLTNQHLRELKNIFKNKITVFTGQSGAGKSSLLNKLDQKLSLKTNEISKSLGRGKHTTRCTTLYEINDGLVADTPGFSMVDFHGMSKVDIRNNMKEMYNNLDKCKYRDCMHIKEEGCYIKKMVENGEILVSRYNNYMSFIGEK